MGSVIAFFKIIGIFIRWIIEYHCSLEKEKINELMKDEDGKNLWYSLSFYAILIVWVVLFQTCRW